MGKSRKRLAVLLAATMAISMMTGFTSFAAEGDNAEDPVVVKTTTPDTTTPDTTTPDTTTPDTTTVDTTTVEMSVAANAPVLYGDTDEPEEAEEPETDESETDEPEVPETRVYIANNYIEEKDEFVSLGEDKGEYKYYDGTLVLKNVVIEI